MVAGVTKLDRLARSTRHLVTLVAEFDALGVDLAVLEQAIDTTTPAGRLLFHVLAAISEFERDLIKGSSDGRSTTRAVPGPTAGPATPP
jgi:DNA invertase Pin-like site-specific DNA recombinase